MVVPPACARQATGNSIGPQVDVAEAPAGTSLPFAMSANCRRRSTYFGVKSVERDIGTRLRKHYLAYSGSAVDALHQAQAQIYAMVQRQAAFLSFNDSFWLMAIILVAMVPFVFLMRKPPPGAAPLPTH
jgi:hypothetical protein